jgi:hypothetical protein
MCESYLNCTKNAALMPGELGLASAQVKPAVPANAGSHHEVIFPSQKESEETIIDAGRD